MDIREIRQKYPQYEDLSDQELAQALHSKYYSDIPFDEFSKTIGLGFSASEMVSNIPRSAMQFGKNIWDAATNPVDTAKGVSDLVLGGAQWIDRKLDDTPLAPFSFTPANLADDKTQVAETFGRSMYDRYGSVDNLLNTLEQDPVGLLADASSVTMPLTKGLLNPVAIPKNAARTVAGKLSSKRMPAKMYERAAKWRPGIADDAARARLTETALRNRLLPNSAGTVKLQSLINGFNTKIDDLISKAQSTGKTIPRKELYKYIDDLKKEAGGWNIDAPRDLKIIDNIVDGFEQHASTSLPSQMTARDLQRFKVKTYESINWDARRLRGTRAGEDARKAVARSAKEGVEELVPEVGPINRQLSDLYNLQPELERVSGRLGNRNMIPLEAPLEVGVGAGVGSLLGPEGAMIGGGLGAGASLLGHYAVSPRLALWLRGLQEQSLMGLLSNQGPVSMGLLGAGQADRINDLQAE